MSSSPYVVLGNRSIDKWKVTELKEELKKRRLITSGLKADLIRRLDEAVRIEWENTKEQNDNTSATGESHLNNGGSSEPTADVISNPSQSNSHLNITDSGLPFYGSLEASMNVVPQNESNFQNVETQIHDMDTAVGKDIDSGSVQNVSTESFPISEKNELMLDAKTDDVKSDVDVKHPTLSGSAADGDVEEPPEEKLQVDEVNGGTAATVDSLQQMDKEDFDAPENLGLEQNSKDASMDENVGTNDNLGKPLEKQALLETDGGNIKNDTLDKVDTLDLDPPEKLSIDQSSSDEFMEDDALESKQVEQIANTCDIKETMEGSTMPVEQVEKFDSVRSIDNPLGSRVGNSDNEPVKRKFTDKEGANIDKGKKQRIYDADDLKISEKQSGTDVDSSAHRKLPNPTLRTFSKSDSTASQEAPKERVVPPSSNPPSSSLRIDNFLRPFTLKAVQELLAKTGTVTNFWMDQIKTHCYVSYSSIEEAVETRNAVYNLQWPPQGGRLLVAEFVDPQEVKSRVETPQLPATPISTKAQQPQQVTTHPIPPQPLLSNQPSIRECTNLSRKPIQEKDRQAQKIPEEVDPPILTLDDLFHKTKATPRIYYLPLSDEQVATKLKAQEKDNNTD